MKYLAIVLLIITANFCVFSQTINSNPTQPPPNQKQSYQRPEKKKRFRTYIKNMVGPSAFAGPFLSASYNQIRKNPEEWERNSRGFAKRFGNSVGRNVINQTVIYSLDEALKVDSAYYPSRKKDLKSKIKNAVVSTFTARNEQGKRVLGIPRIAGAYTSAIIANEVWMPNRFSYKDGFRDGSLSLGMKVLINIAKEVISRK